MPKKNVYLLDLPGGSWSDFLEEFFEDTPTTVGSFTEPKSLGEALSARRPDVLFLHPELVNITAAQKIRALKQTHPMLRVFVLGKEEHPLSGVVDESFTGCDSLTDFQSRLVRTLPFPERLSILVVDDEPEVGRMLAEYLEGRTEPAFEVRCAGDGRKGLAAIEEKRPDVLVLDIKMPVCTGHEVYRTIKRQQGDFPVIIFFDAISGDEVSEIHEIGRPAIVEKGSYESSIPQLVSLIKKMAFFA